MSSSFYDAVEAVWKTFGQNGSSDSSIIIYIRFVRRTGEISLFFRLRLLYTKTASAPTKTDSSFIRRRKNMKREPCKTGVDTYRASHNAGKHNDAYP